MLEGLLVLLALVCVCADLTHRVMCRRADAAEGRRLPDVLGSTSESRILDAVAFALSAAVLLTGGMTWIGWLSTESCVRVVLLTLSAFPIISMRKRHVLRESAGPRPA